MKATLIIAASFALTTTACFAGDSCSNKSSCDTKKVSILSKLFHKKGAVEAKKSSSGDTDMQVAGTNFIIN